MICGRTSKKAAVTAVLAVSLGLGWSYPAKAALKMDPKTLAIISAPATKPSADCEIQPLSTPGMADRGRVIRFPDGREITVIGHNHGSRTLAESIDSAMTDDDPKAISNKDFLANLSFMTEQRADSVHDSKQDVAFLRAYLAKHPEARFVGVEGTDQVIVNNLKVYQALRAKLHHQFEVRKLAPNPLEANTEMAAFGASFYLKMTEPGLFAGRKLVGFENETLGQDYLDANEAMESAKRQLGSADLDTATMSKLAAFLNPMTAKYVTYRPENDDAKILKSAQSQFSGKLWTAFQPYLKAQLGLMKAMKLRDRADAETISRQPSSCVVFIGKAHLDSLVAMLKTSCEKSLATAAKPAPTSKTSSATK